MYFSECRLNHHTFRKEKHYLCQIKTHINMLHIALLFEWPTYFAKMSRINQKLDNVDLLSITIFDLHAKTGKILD